MDSKFLVITGRGFLAPPPVVSNRTPGLLELSYLMTSQNVINGTAMTKHGAHPLKAGQLDSLQSRIFEYRIDRIIYLEEVIKKNMVGQNAALKGIRYGKIGFKER
jgi:hypothetical protein